MPLKLLKHKSWNVYSEQNKERVRNDEEAARRAEDAEEQRMQQEDAAVRLSLLRRSSQGRTSAPPPEPTVTTALTPVAPKRVVAERPSGLVKPIEPWYKSRVAAGEADQERRERARLRGDASDPLHLMNAYVDRTIRHRESRQRRHSRKHRISK